MDFLEALSRLIQDERDRRRPRLLEARFALPERKDRKSLGWICHPRLPRRDALELATPGFIAARADVLLTGDLVVFTPLPDSLMHRGHLLGLEGKSSRLKEAAARVAKRSPAQ